MTEDERLAAARAFAYGLYLASCRAEYPFELHIQNPYLIPGEDGSQLLHEERDRLKREAEESLEARAARLAEERDFAIAEVRDVVRRSVPQTPDGIARMLVASPTVTVKHWKGVAVRDAITTPTKEIL